MDSSNVLKKYIELVNNNLNELEYHLASNSVMEWFGRTFKSSKRIHENFRYDLTEQYEHNFSMAESCSPFESKPTHLITIKVPPENLLDPVTSPFVNTTCSSNRASDVFKTPPQSPMSPKLPEVTQGRIFIEEDSDSDLEDNEVSDLNLSGVEEILDSTHDSPPKKEYNAELCKNIGIKRSEPSGSRSFTEEEPSQKIPKTNSNTEDFIDLNESDEGFTSQSFCNDLPDNERKKSNHYSELRYIQSNGILRQMRPAKHRGVSNSILNNSTDDPASISSISPHIIPSSSSSTTSNNPWDRPTCLKLSYRIRLSDNHIQFALIIYDSITKNPNTRRNLVDEFKKTQSNENNLSRRKNLFKSEKRTLVPSMKKSLRF